MPTPPTAVSDGSAPAGTVDPAELTRRLLMHSPEPSVTDALLPYVAAQSLRALVPMGAPPSSQMCQRLLGPGISPEQARLLTAAPVTDPAILTGMARHPHPAVVRAAAANVHTPRAEIERLTQQALDTGDEDLAAALTANVEPTSWMRQSPLNTGHWRSGVSIIDNVLRQLEHRADPQLTLDTVNSAAHPWNRMTELLGGILLRASDGRLPVTPSEVVDVVDKHNQRSLDEMFTHALEQHPAGEPLPDPFAAALGAYLAETRHTPDTTRRILRRARPASAVTVAHLLASKELCAAVGVIVSHNAGLAPLTDAQLEELTTRTEPGIARELMERPRVLERLTDAQLEKVSERAPGNPAFLEKLLGRPERLTDRTQVNLLRAGSHHVTGKWITGALASAPTRHTARMLASDPGRALTEQDDRGTTAGAARRLCRGGVSDLVRSHAATFTLASLDQPGVTDVLDEAAAAVVELACDALYGLGANPFLHYLTRRVNERFGPDPQAWSTLPAAAATAATGTVTELLDVVAALTDTTP